MPAEVFEDALDLHIDLLEAELPTAPEAGGSFGYPFPSLKRIGDQETRRFRSILLENESLRLTVIPGLGGRILSLFDKRRQTEILDIRSNLVVREGGSRGVYLPDGITFEPHLGARALSLGNVDSLLIPGQDEGDSASVWLGETVSGTPLSFHQQIGLHPSSAIVETRFRVLNRSLIPQPYLGRVVFPLGEGQISPLENGVAWCSPTGLTGLAITFEPGTFASLEFTDGVLTLGRFDKEDSAACLMSRQSDEFGFSLTPFGTLSGVDLVNEHGVFQVSPSSVGIHPAYAMSGYRMLVQNREGATFEAALDAYPENPVQLDLSSIPGEVAGVVIRNPERHEVARMVVGVERAWKAGVIDRRTDRLRSVKQAFEELNETSDSQSLGRYSRIAETRVMALHFAAQSKAKLGEYASADAIYEQVLLYNGDDPLTWWAKAVMKRLAGTDEEGAERVELLNAHFLSPLEPALRAEAFLSQEQTHGKDPSPLVAPLAENPENFIEVACLLIELGLSAEATRWIDESLRHKDLAMLHYLQASLYLASSRMEVEAGEHVSRAGRAQLPPYPFRDVEKQALVRLRDRFPDERKVVQLLGLMEHLSSESSIF